MERLISGDVTLKALSCFPVLIPRNKDFIKHSSRSNGPLTFPSWLMINAISLGGDESFPRGDGIHKEMGYET